MTLLFMNFLKIGLTDIMDILLVATLFYLLYRLIKGTAALNIFLGLLLLYVSWKLVMLLNMELTSELLNQFLSVGFIALIIVFQPEIRQFLLFVGSKNPFKKATILVWKERNRTAGIPDFDVIVNSCVSMAASYTGALIVLTKENQLEEYIQTGERINARTSQELIETIFFKNTPLHDGALIINRRQMVAARCILPVTKKDVASDMGLRHRSALGITEETDCIAIVVSEQTGSISYCVDGHITRKVSAQKLKSFLEQQYKIIK